MGCSDSMCRWPSWSTSTFGVAVCPTTGNAVSSCSRPFAWLLCPDRRNWAGMIGPKTRPAASSGKSSMSGSSPAPQFYTRLVFLAQRVETGNSSVPPKSVWVATSTPSCSAQGPARFLWAWNFGKSEEEISNRIREPSDTRHSIGHMSIFSVIDSPGVYSRALKPPSR